MMEDSVIKLTCTQEKALRGIDEGGIEKWTSQIPFRRSSQTHYLDPESFHRHVFSNKTYDNLIQLGLIKTDIAYQAGFGTYRSKVIITDLGTTYLEK